MNYKRLFIPNTMLFITIVTKYRRPILVKEIVVLRKSFVAAKKWNPFQIVAIIVNYDHLHMIIRPQEISTYPKIIANIKRMFTKLSHIQYDTSKCGESDIWQRRYWEHTIKDEKDLYKHLDYIHYNSVKHYGIPPQKWPFSSFHKFVEKGYYPFNWCNDDDKYQIKNMDLE